MIAQTAVSHLRGNGNDACAAGGKLNVRTVLTGRIARERDLQRVSCELVEAASGRRLWGDHYSTLPLGIFALEKKICDAISEQLVHPLGTTVENTRRNPTANPEAHQDYLRGRFFASKMSKEDLRRSIAYFQSALKLDSGFAPPYAGLAHAYSLLAMLGGMPAAAARNRVAEFVAAALQMDPKLAEAHAALASLKQFFDWDWAGAEQAYVAALELDANCPDGRHWYANLLCAMDRPEEALMQIRRAQELDPLSLVISAEALLTSNLL